MRCARCSTTLPPESSVCPHCGSAATFPLNPTDGEEASVPARLLAAGTVLPGGTYRIEAVLGEGSMGVVYLAHDRALDRQVAIKALHSNLLGHTGIRRRFLREARVLLAAWSHPNVATLYDTLSHDDLLAIVMEYVDGPTLHELIRRWQGRMPLPEAGAIAQGMLAGLNAAHARGVVHRDIKPSNVMLVSQADAWVPKLIDFGIAKVLEGTTYTMTGALLGTCRYMSPEQVQTPREIGPATDVYAFGITLFEMLTGHPPFDDPNHFNLMMCHVKQAPPDPRVSRTDLPDAWAELVLACLDKQPANRPDVPTLQSSLTQLGVAEPPAHVPSAPSAHGSQVHIPAGPFPMGPDRRTVVLDGFHIDRTPVTNAQFQAFITATGYRPEHAQRFLAHWLDDGPPPSLRQHPVVYVSWFDAVAYAQWVGLRLPTEAEWEKAARGTDGRRFPWGRTQPTPSMANFGGRGGTTAVDAHPDGASVYGVLDLAGNVWEWCADADDPAFYLSGPSRNPRGPQVDQSTRAVVRGGAWMFQASALRTWSRSSFDPNTRMESLGFRCAAHATQAPVE